MTTLFDPLRIGDFVAANRIMMAPLTRDRSGPAGVPLPMAATYYGQRATAGLIITEGTQISAEGQGYLDTPGIYTPDQIASWRRVTDAVHEKGGKIAVQLWHVGRISHVSLLPKGIIPVSSSARPADAKTFTKEGFVQVSPPRALTTAEIPRVIADFRRAARCAMDAGFDAVEVHGAHGYLVEQFLRDSINDRSDEYGGTLANRVRFGVEVMSAIVEEIGAGRTGIRLSPVSPVNDTGQDSNSQVAYEQTVTALARLKLAFIHVVEGWTGVDRDSVKFDYESLRKRFKAGNETGAWIVNNRFSGTMAEEFVERGSADAVAFGKPFISNPDLVRRLKEGAPLTPTIEATMYGGGAEGYIDYPTMDGSPA